jgi:hypothetical protein
MAMMLERRFRKTLNAAIATPSDVAAGIGKAYRTLRSYQDGTRQVTLDSSRALSRYLRRKARAMLKAADALDTVISKQEGHDA